MAAFCTCPLNKLIDCAVQGTFYFPIICRLSVCFWERCVKNTHRGRGGIITLLVYMEVCPEGIQPCKMKNRDIYSRRYEIQETLYIGQWRLSPLQSSHLGTTHSSVWIKSLATAVCIPSAPVAEAKEQILPWHVSCQDPVSKSQRQQCLEFPDQLLVFALWVSNLCWLESIHVQPSQVSCLLPAFQTMDHFQPLLDHVKCWSVCAILLFALHSLHCNKCSLNQPNSFCGGMFKHNAKFNEDLLLYLLSHFKCDGHTVHVLTQRHLPPPLTSAVKSSLFTHAHSSPLSLPGYINVMQTILVILTNGWTFSRQTSYIIICLYAISRLCFWVHASSGLLYFLDNCYYLSLNNCPFYT